MTATKFTAGASTSHQVSDSSEEEEDRSFFHSLLSNSSFSTAKAKEELLESEEEEEEERENEFQKYEFQSSNPKNISSVKNVESPKKEVFDRSASSSLFLEDLESGKHELCKLSFPTLMNAEMLEGDTVLINHSSDVKEKGLYMEHTSVQDALLLLPSALHKQYKLSKWKMKGNMRVCKMLEKCDKGSFNYDFPEKETKHSVPTRLKRRNPMHVLSDVHVPEVLQTCNFDTSFTPGKKKKHKKKKQRFSYEKTEEIVMNCEALDEAASTEDSSSKKRKNKTQETRNLTTENADSEIVYKKKSKKRKRGENAQEVFVHIKSERESIEIYNQDSPFKKRKRKREKGFNDTAEYEQDDDIHHKKKRKKRKR